MTSDGKAATLVGCIEVAPLALLNSLHPHLRCGFVENNMDDRIEGDTGRAGFNVTLLIVKCVAGAALFTAAVWFVVNFVLDSVFR